MMNATREITPHLDPVSDERLTHCVDALRGVLSATRANELMIKRDSYEWSPSLLAILMRYSGVWLWFQRQFPDWTMAMVTIGRADQRELAIKCTHEVR